MALWIEDTIQASCCCGGGILFRLAAEDKHWRQFGIFDLLVSERVSLVVLQVLSYRALLVHCPYCGDDRISENCMRDWTYKLLWYLQNLSAQSRITVCSYAAIKCCMCI